MGSPSMHIQKVASNNYKYSLNPALPVYLIAAICWGAGYPLLFRIPAFILGSPILFVAVKKIKRSNGSIAYSIGSLLILVFVSLISWTSHNSFLYVISLCIYVYYCSSVLSVAYNPFLSNKWIYSSFCISLLIAVVSVIFGKYSNIEFLNSTAGIFPEPSNLGFTLGPIIGFLFSNSKFRFFAFAAFLFFIYTTPSASLVSGFIFSLIIAFSLRINSLLVVLFLLIVATMTCIALIGLDISNTDALFKPGSTIVLYHKIIFAINLIFDQGNFIGVGPLGWLDGAYGELVAEGSDLTTYNQRDLSSLIPYGLASFGLLFPIAFSLLALHLHARLRRLAHTYNIIDPFTLLLLSYIMTFCVRWTGITPSPILAIISFFLVPFKLSQASMKD